MPKKSSENGQSIDILALKGLIAKKAIESWYKLPQRTRAYTDVEDLIQEGIIYARYSLLRRYNHKRAKFSTLLYRCLENHYHNMAESLNAKKRFDGFAIPVEDVEKTYIDTAADTIEINSHIVVAFIGVYTEASEELRESMHRWFLQQKATKVHTRSHRFMKDRREFLKLAGKYELDSMDCRILMNSTKCRDRVMKKLPENIIIPLGSRDELNNKNTPVLVMQRAV